MHNHLSEKNQKSTIDNLLKQIAITFINTDLGNPKRNELERIDSITNYEFGDNLNRFFMLKDDLGKTIYKSRTVDILKLEGTPISPEWISLGTETSQIRIYNIRNPNHPNRVLQVGLVFSKEDNFNFSHLTLIFLFLCVAALGVLSSWLLSSFMFSPISKVGDFLTKASLALDNRGTLPNVPKKLFFSSKDSDELGKLTKDLDTLINKINSNYKISRLWAAQMAHELKTPLSQLLLHIESTAQGNDTNTKKSFVYIERIKNTINTFLNWAELESSANSTQKLEAVSVTKCLRHLIELMPEETKKNIVLNVAEDLLDTEPTVMCNAEHLAQLAQNMISNALKYSEGKVTVAIYQDFFSVQDEGCGLPPEVLEKMGEPFNFGNSQSEKRGHGLGLAWIKTICHIYGWQLHTISSPKGTLLKVLFDKNTIVG